MDWSQVVQTIFNWLSTAGVKVIIALVLLVISFRLINWLSKKVEKASEKRFAMDAKLDKTLTRALGNVTKIVLKIVVCAGIVGYLGLDTSGITALIASLGVGVGLAVNGTISNLAGGVLLLFTRPFKDDDYIEACGYAGTVEDIFICNTKLRTVDNKVVYIPNGKLSTSEVVNYSEKPTRRVDLTFSIGYGEDFEAAKAVIQEICAAHPLILKDPAPDVRVSAHSASSVDLTAKVWVNNADYWTVHFDLLERVKAEFDAKGIEIPFEQVDVHIKKD